MMPSEPDSTNQNKTPEELARHAFDSDASKPPIDTTTLGGKMPKSKRFAFKNLRDLTKKQKILLGIVVVLVVGLISFLIWWFVLRAEPNTVQPNTVVEEEVEEPKPTTEASRVTGLQVKPEVNKRHVTGVMIENSPEARPQSGLRDADIVYEAVAEGGITRFLALFHDTESKYIGPIRSARPYYLDFLLPFDASIAHVGGSPDALALIKALRVKDLDQFANSGAYERISSRYAPHNVYSSVAKLDAIEKAKGFTESDFEGFKRKAETPTPDKVTAKDIDFSISSLLYNSHYDYDKANNNYVRSQAGKRHNDEKSGKPIVADVVVAMVMQKGIHADGHHTTYKSIGTGTVFIFQNGKVVRGKWQKKSRNTQFAFLDKNNNPIELNPGKTWISIVGSTSGVRYKP